MRFDELAQVSREVAATPKRSDKTSLLADVIARLPEEQIEAGVTFLSGATRQKALGVGYATLASAVPRPAPESDIDVGDVDRAFEAIAALAGEGSQQARSDAVVDLLGRATQPGQEMLVGLMAGELRQGASWGLVQDGVAKAFAISATLVRRAVMLTGNLGHTALLAKQGGSAALEGVTLEVGRPVQPMLATTADAVGDALHITGRASLEWKLDGARIQVHRQGTEVRIFTRNLRDITPRLPDVVSAITAVDADAVVLDGEAISLDNDGRPLPFQDTASAFGTDAAVTGMRPFFFDILHLDGKDLIDETLEARWRELERLVPEVARVPRMVTEDPAHGQAFFDEVVGLGHEGVVVKALESPYQAGRRGKAWVKVKPVHTLDLVVLAAEWGHGRRSGWLSNLHLGARDPDSDDFIMLGKTFKGLTDELLEWQTNRFQELKMSETRRTVHVRPEQVVEIAIDGVQRSPRYPGGVALRFARVRRYRDDKVAAEADTIDDVRSYL